MAYYHDLITEQSWQELQTLQKKVRFVLIGGWATYLYTKTLKSKDIDILIDYDQLPILEKDYVLSKNDRLKKYEARKGSVEIDIYLPHFSELGIPVEHLIKQAWSQEGFQVIQPDFLLTLKLHTLSQRGRGPKGKKDFIDIISLFRLPQISGEKTRQLLKEYHLDRAWKDFLEFLSEYHDVPELHLNRHQFSKIKKKVTQ